MNACARRTTRVIAALLALPLLSGVGLKRAAARSAPKSAAAAHADLTGEWWLDVARSQFGGSAHTPKSRTDRIVHRDPELLVRSLTVRPAGDSLALEYRYRTNGESTNKVMGQDVRTAGKWDGAALALSSHATMLMMDLSVAERWSVSADGRTLTEVRASKGPTGEVKQTLVFQKH